MAPLKEFEVAHHGLVHQDIAVGQKENAFFGTAFEQAPDDLEKRYKFCPCLWKHDQQHAVLTSGNGFERAVDGMQLVVARHTVAVALVVSKAVDTGLLRRPAFPLLIEGPQLGGEGNSSIVSSVSNWPLNSKLASRNTKPSPLLAKAKGAHALCVFRGLLHASTHGVAVVFGFNHRQRLAKLVAQQEVRTQSRLHIALCLLAAHHDATWGNGVFAVDLIDLAQPACTTAGLMNFAQMSA